MEVLKEMRRRGTLLGMLESRIRGVLVSEKIASLAEEAGLHPLSSVFKAEEPLASLNVRL